MVYNDNRSVRGATISARGEAGYRSGFRFQRPGVRIPPSGPERVHQKDAPFFYALFIRVSEQKHPQNLKVDFIDENSLF